MSPTQRALKDLKALGITAEVVEKWNPHARVRVDLFGVIDIIAIGFGAIIGIQATSASNHAARRTKALAEPKLAKWLNCAGSFEIWSYGLKGAKGKRKRYELRREQITAKDFV